MATKHEPTPPLTIQRVPRSLLELLGNYGGQTPHVFADQVRGVLDLMQFYGKSGRTVFTNSAVLAEGVTVALTVPANEHWVFFSGFTRVTKTATMTALSAAFYLEGQVVAAQEFQRFGATETGSVDVPFFAPYPVILVPGATVQGAATIIGTDANATVSIQCLVGVLG